MLFIFLFSFFTTYSFAEKFQELELKNIKFSETQLRPEISGLWMWSNKSFIVSDRPDDHFIYEILSSGKDRFKIKPFINLKTLKSAEAYLKKDDLDLEGLSGCGEDFYLVNERRREILKVSKNTFEFLDIDFSKTSGVYEGIPNAGFEAVAVDCEKQIMYVGKEREPTFIVKVDLATKKAMGIIEPVGSSRLGQKVISFKTGEDLIEVSKDVSDLFYSNGFLYVLERNQYAIQKIDLATEKMVARYSYFFTEKDLYSTGEPFGIAEALFLTKDEIILGIDQNAAPLSVHAEKKYKQKGARGALLYFKRPEGF
jgi:hypothetical protein